VISDPDSTSERSSMATKEAEKLEAKEAIVVVVGATGTPRRD
jgi:hypothetical protein